ncbi:hypothetical protein C5167_026374 [Papaver somniferum]|nr:hypothetical protein C5167_026374 [Papaver somniferum]
MTNRLGSFVSTLCHHHTMDAKFDDHAQLFMLTVVDTAIRELKKVVSREITYCQDFAQGKFDDEEANVD